MTYHDQYDPELHDNQAPPANRGLAIAVTMILVALPFVIWGWLS